MKPSMARKRPSATRTSEQWSSLRPRRHCGNTSRCTPGRCMTTMPSATWWCRICRRSVPGCRPLRTREAPLARIPMPWKSATWEMAAKVIPTRARRDLAKATGRRARMERARRAKTRISPVPRRTSPSVRSAGRPHIPLTSAGSTPRARAREAPRAMFSRSSRLWMRLHP